MRLCGYNVTLTVATFKALHHLLQYLYHHPYVLIMYQRKSLKHDEILHVHQAYGQAEIYETSSPYLQEEYTNANLGRDLMNRRSVSSTLHCFNGTVVTWSAFK